MKKEALIGEHHLKSLLNGHKESIDWYSLLGNKPVITQVHLYDILVINTHPVITKVHSYDILAINTHPQLLLM